MVDVKNRWCLITGASRGIGKLIADEMAKCGANLILHSRSKAHTAQLEEEYKNSGIECFSVESDLNDLASVEKMLEEIDNSGKRVDIVFNDAGLQIAYRTDYYSTPFSDYLVSFNVNTIAPMMICYHFLPKMIEYGFGRVINTTSGIDGEPEQAGYSAAKAALNKVTLDIARKLDGTDVILSLSDPGWCRTDLGGPHAPNAPESTIPGMIVGAFVDDKRSGRLFGAQEYTGLALEQAVQKAADAPSVSVNAR